MVDVDWKTRVAKLQVRWSFDINAWLFSLRFLFLLLSLILQA